MALRLRGLQHKNDAAELLEELLKDELKARPKRNLVQSQEECPCGVRGATRPANGDRSQGKGTVCR